MQWGACGEKRIGAARLEPPFRRPSSLDNFEDRRPTVVGCGRAKPADCVNHFARARIRRRLISRRASVDPFMPRFHCRLVTPRGCDCRHLGCCCCCCIIQLSVADLLNCLGLVFYAPQLYRRVLLIARISDGNSVRLSVRPAVTTRYRIKPRSDRDTGFSPYDSLEFLVSNEEIWCRWVPLGDNIPLERGNQRGVPPKKS